MTKYFVIEIQESAGGDAAYIVHAESDEDPKTAKLKAESKYHQVLSAAAISDVPHHSAIMIDFRAFPKMNYEYDHTEPEIEE